MRKPYDQGVTCRHYRYECKHCKHSNHAPSQSNRGSLISGGLKRWVADPRHAHGGPQSSSRFICETVCRKAPWSQCVTRPARHSIGRASGARAEKFTRKVFMPLQERKRKYRAEGKGFKYHTPKRSSDQGDDLGLLFRMLFASLRAPRKELRWDHWFMDRMFTALLIY